MATLTLDDQIEHTLKSTKRIALVGASNKPHRPSYDVMQTLLSHGYQVTPVNPRLAGQTILGQQVVATLDDAAPLDMVDVFRDPSHAGAIMADAIRLGAKSVWLQIGVVDDEAAQAGRAAGLTVIMDRCPKIELPRLGLRAFRADAE